jgi:hypothetical protein
MVLEFYDAPLGVADNPVSVVFTAKDTDSGEHVECRILHDVLVKKYSSQGIAPNKLRDAFYDNREELLEATQRKYEQGQIERTADGVILILSLADFGPL